MVGENLGVATMGSLILSHKPEDFETGRSVLTTVSIVSRSPNSKNVAHVGPHKTHNYECSGFVRNLGSQPWVSRFYYINPEDFGTGKSVLTTQSIGFHSQNSKNAPNFGPPTTHNYECSWWVKFGM